VRPEPAGLAPPCDGSPYDCAIGPGRTARRRRGKTPRTRGRAASRTSAGEPRDPSVPTTSSAGRPAESDLDDTRMRLGGPGPQQRDVQAAHAAGFSPLLDVAGRSSCVMEVPAALPAPDESSSRDAGFSAEAVLRHCGTLSLGLQWCTRTSVTDRWNDESVQGNRIPCMSRFKGCA
jgi:hypothetical protein